MENKRERTVRLRIEKEKASMVEQLQRTPIIQVACEKLNISRSSHYRWCKEDKDYEKKINAAVGDGIFLVNDLAESQLISAVKDRDMRAITLWLRSNHPRYRQKVELSGKVNVIEELSPEQEDLIREAMNLAGLPSQNYELETRKTG